MISPMKTTGRGSGRETTEISVDGRFLAVPAVTLDTVTVAVTGRFLRTGFIKGEGWLDPRQVGAPESIVETLKQRRAPLDIFVFHQRLPEVEPRYAYPHERENVAAIPLTTFEAWWEGRASQVTRKNVRRSVKRGVEVRRVEFDDRLIEAIVRINNEMPFRNGRKFWHFGKGFDAVKKDYSAYLDRSEFLGAFHDGELIGFLRLIDQGEVASIMQLLSLNSHYDKRPSNALIAKAVELCVEKGKTFLVYGQYLYDDDADNPLTEFKRRNGFAEFLVPVFFVPFTFRGRAAIKLHLHAGVRRLVPRRLLKTARTVRAKVFERRRKAVTPDSPEGE